MLLLPQIRRAVTSRVGMARRWQSSSGASALNTQLSSALSDMRETGTYKVERVITTPQETSISASRVSAWGYQLLCKQLPWPVEPPGPRRGREERSTRTVLAFRPCASYAARRTYTRILSARYRNTTAWTTPSFSRPALMPMLGSLRRS